MKKRIVTLLLSGLMVVGGLSLNMFAVVQAEEADGQECGFTTREHITDYAIAENSDGQLTVTVNLTGVTPTAGTVYGGSYGGIDEGYITFYTVEEYVGDGVEVEDVTAATGVPEWDDYIRFLWTLTGVWYDEGHTSRCNNLCIGQSGTYVLPELTAGKTYYVYAILNEFHNFSPDDEYYDEHTLMYLNCDHTLMYLGSGTPTKDSGSVYDEIPPASDTSDNTSPADNASAVSGKKARRGTATKFSRTVPII